MTEGHTVIVNYCESQKLPVPSEWINARLKYQSFLLVLTNTADYLAGCLGFGCLGGAVVWRQTRDQKVAGSTPGRGAIKSTRSTHPSIPPG